MAFVFMNRYLDLTEAMDDPDAGPLENADFVGTDIPYDFTIPDTHFIAEATREEVCTSQSAPLHATKMHFVCVKLQYRSKCIPVCCTSSGDAAV